MPPKLKYLLHLLGLSVDGEGLRPSTAESFKLFFNNGTTPFSLSNVQLTLQWFRKFIPNFSYVIRPILVILRATCHQINFDEKCQLAIKKDVCGTTVRPYSFRIPNEKGNFPLYVEGTPSPFRSIMLALMENEQSSNFGRRSGRSALSRIRFQNAFHWRFEKPWSNLVGVERLTIYSSDAVTVTLANDP